MLKKNSLLLILLCNILQAQIAQNPVEKGLAIIHRDMLQSQLTYLSSDWFEGREASTKGAHMAADYLASLYHQAGLKPAGDDETFFQQVPLIINTKASEATLTLLTPQHNLAFILGHDFDLQTPSISYSISGSIDWVGYGNETILAKKYAGKIVVRLNGLPENAPKELQALKTSELTTLKKKIASQANVKAILEYDLNDPYLKKLFKEQGTSNPEKPVSGIYSRQYLLPGEQTMEIPVVKISRNVMQQMIPNLDEQMAKWLEKGTSPAIQATAAIETKAATKITSCRNVIARMEGRELPDEIIVVGAHYDHLGSYNGFIWNGADDNASGAIGVAAIAAAFKATGIQPKRTIIFANWTAEERGLLGSRYFVNNYNQIDKVICYHNYDMIGRSYDPKKSDMAVSLMYSKTWPKAELLSDRFNKEHNLGLNIHFSPWDNPTSGSDNAYFAKLGIPIMWYHTGGHAEYHQPGDQAEHIDWQKLEAIIKNSFLTLWELANE